MVLYIPAGLLRAKVVMNGVITTICKAEGCQVQGSCQVKGSKVAAKPASNLSKATHGKRPAPIPQGGSTCFYRQGKIHVHGCVLRLQSSFHELQEGIHEVKKAIQVSAGECSAMQVTDAILRSTGNGTLSQHGLKNLT